MPVIERLFKRILRQHKKRQHKFRKNPKGLKRSSNMFWIVWGEHQGDFQNLCRKGQIYMRLKKDQSNRGSRKRMLGLRKSCMEVLDKHEL
jgi:hypothetical protein